MKRIQILSSFHIKILAIILMTIDHIGAFFIDPTTSLEVYEILRIIGRLSFPLFGFLVVEAMTHSHNKIKYISKLLIMSVTLNVIALIATKNYEDNIFTDLFFAALVIYLLQFKNRYSFLAVIPIVHVILAGFAFYPIKVSYGIYGLAIIVGFYLSKVVADISLRNKADSFNVELDAMKMEYGQQTYNMYAALSLFVTISIFYIFYLYSIMALLPPSFTIQSYAVFSLVFLLCYNGKLGYTSKVLQYGCYLYYPLHIGIFYIIQLFI